MRNKGMTRLAACTMAVCMTIAAAGCGRKVDYNVGDESSQTGEAESSSDETANSDADENSQEELDAETGGTLVEQLGIPEACDVEFDTGDSGLSSITCKADEISLPEGDRTQKAVYEVYDCGTEALTQICNALLDADKGVNAREDGVYTKAEIEADIESAKEALQRAQESGYEELLEKAEDDLAYYQAELDAAVDSLPEVTEYAFDVDYTGWHQDRQYNLKVSKQGDGTSYGIYINYALTDDELAQRADEADEALENLLSDGSGATYSDVSVYMAADGDNINTSDLTNTCKLTEEEAENKAMDFIEALGVSGFQAEDVKDLATLWSVSDEDSGVESVLKCELDGYAVELTRKVAGGSIVCDDIGGLDNFSDTDTDTYISYTSDDATVYVNDSGVMAAYITAYTDGGTVQTEDVDILSWNDMIKAAEKNIAAYYAKYPTSYDEVNFNQVSLVYLPYADDEGATCYIPVWRFAETMEGHYLYETYEEVVQLAYINAIDGSYVDIAENAQKLGFTGTYK